VVSGLAPQVGLVGGGEDEGRVEEGRGRRGAGHLKNLRFIDDRHYVLPIDACQ
jgi:hypothetical protein